MDQLYFPKRGGAGASPRLPLARATPVNNQRLRTATFRSSQSWTIPKNVSNIRIAIGEGQDGQPATGEHEYVDGYTTYRERIYSVNGGPTQSDPEQNMGDTVGSPVPSDYCDPPVTDGDTTYIYCYRFVYKEIDIGDYQPPTTGSNTSAFSRTFPGGVGVPAVPRTYQNIPVTPGATVTITIAPGGFLTIYY